MSNTNNSAAYLKTFFTETTKVDQAESFGVEGAGEVIYAVMTYGEIVTAIANAPRSEQDKIADTIRRIDFLNGDVAHFLRHLGRALVLTAAEGR